MVTIIEGDCANIMLNDMETAQFDCIVADPPFGIGYDGKSANHNRDKKKVMDGYTDIPTKDYYEFMMGWLKGANHVLKEDGSMWVISSWNNMDISMRAIKDSGFTIINDVIWKYNFGVYTKRKFVSSHYHLLYCCHEGFEAERYFDRECRFADDEKDDRGKMQYRDREDVWWINKDYIKGTEKVATRLPKTLVMKMLQYVVKSGDHVLDPFAGSGTTGAVCNDLACKCVLIDQNPACINYMKRSGL